MRYESKLLPHKLQHANQTSTAVSSREAPTHGQLVRGVPGSGAQEGDPRWRAGGSYDGEAIRYCRAGAQSGGDMGSRTSCGSGEFTRVC